VPPCNTIFCMPSIPSALPKANAKGPSKPKREADHAREELAVALRASQAALRSGLEERDRLATIVEQTTESVIVTDLDAHITYVNPAFERMTGYSRGEVIGQNPRLLSSGAQQPEFYKAMWASLTTGTPWVSEHTNRCKDGTLISLQSVVSAIHDVTGAITGYVALQRNVTAERTREHRYAQAARERALIAETLRGLGGQDAPEVMAQLICTQILGLTGVTSAQLFVFDHDGSALPIGFAVAGQQDPVLQPLPANRSEYLHNRGSQGPWIEPWIVRPEHPYNDLLTALGVHLVAYAPMRSGQELIGLLVIDALESVTEARLAESMPSLVEFANLAAVLIGRNVSERTEVRRVRDEIEHIIGSGAFQPVFQPIVDMGTQSVIGYEALTRFSDGIAPDLHFEQAATAGLGKALETATLRVALKAAELLPPDGWLSVNVSAALILEHADLKALLANSGRPVVMEVTEHEEISDYAAFRVAVAALGPDTRVAVDDAGAGFASLRHILELRPSFVKLDRSLVAGLESDEPRQAMIVGLHHFTRATGCRLIAEGVETQGELDILRTLDVQLAQGFILARPAPAAEFSERTDIGSSGPPEPAEHALKGSA